MTEKTKTISPYGSWLSPLTAKDVAESGVRFGHLQASEHGLYWT